MSASLSDWLFRLAHDPHHRLTDGRDVVNHPHRLPTDQMPASRAGVLEQLDTARPPADLWRRRQSLVCAGLTQTDGDAPAFVCERPSTTTCGRRSTASEQPCRTWFL